MGLNSLYNIKYMKIYINNFNLDVLNNISELFKEFLIKTDNYIELYTNEGMYNIEENCCYKLDVVDKDIQLYNNYYKNFSFIVDHSYFNKKQINGIQGNLHVSLLIVEKTYKLNKNSTFELILKFNNKNNKLIPHDLYFNTNKDIDINNILFKNEIIEFLSVLN